MASWQLSLSGLTWIRFVQLGWIQIWGAGGQLQSEGSQHNCDKCRHLLLAESKSLTCSHCSWWCWDRPAESRSMKCRKEWRRDFFLRSLKKKIKKKEEDKAEGRNLRDCKKTQKSWTREAEKRIISKMVWVCHKMVEEKPGKLIWIKTESSEQPNESSGGAKGQVRDNWRGLIKCSPKVSDE